MLVRRKIQERFGAEQGTAAVIAAFTVMTVLGVSAAIFAIALGTKHERSSAEDRQKALYVANSGVAHVVANLAVDPRATAPVGALDAPWPFSDGGYFVTVAHDEAAGTYVVSSTGSVRAELQSVEAVLRGPVGGIYDNAIFAGNSSGDPLYALELGGAGRQADDVNGDVYSGRDVEVSGDADVSGTISAGGVVTGAPGQGGVTQPNPDIASMDYPNTADIKVLANFVNDPGRRYVSDDAGGSAYQMPESNPAHIFRLNPSDRRAGWEATDKIDFYLEDPYEAVNSDSSQDGSNPYRITMSGIAGDQGPNSNRRVYYIDGNLWLHNKKSFSFQFHHDEPNGIQVTFVVRGNIYFSDNLFYRDPTLDGVAFIAMRDEGVEDSGNIYFGDPEFGTLVQMNAFMYAENNFYDQNLDADGSSTVGLNGNMTAGNQVLIQRDYGDHHTKLRVDWDDRISTGALDMPGLPPWRGGGGEDVRIVAWRTVAHP